MNQTYQILVKHLIFILVLVLLFAAVIQKLTNIIPETNLRGDFIPVQKPIFSWQSYFNESFQAEDEKYLNENIGFRNSLVRLYNQIDYSFFNQTHADGVVAGKRNNLYEYDYIRAYKGDDYLGDRSVDRLIGRLKYIQEYLKREKGIDLIMIFEPGKTTILPEFIPNQYLEGVSGQTNYSKMAEKARELNVRHIDFDNYFRLIKDTISYPLYSKYGTHWSNYGMQYTLDSLIKYIEQIRDIDIPDFEVSNMEITDSLRHPDDDIALAINLLFELPHPPMAYPEFMITSDSGKNKPDVLVIADSYYWNIFNTGLPDSLFNDHEFWYFCNKVYPDFYDNEKLVDRENLIAEIEKWDIVIIMMTHRFLYKLSWGVIDRLYRHYTPVSDYEVLIEKENSIKEYEPWIDELIERSLLTNQSFESVLLKEATYLTYQEDFKKYLILTGEQHYMNMIRNDTSWYKSIKKKAILENRTAEEQLKLDAAYMFNQDHPELYLEYILLHKKMNQLRNDPETYRNVQLQAEKYYTTDSEMLRIIAREHIRDSLGNN